MTPGERLVQLSPLSTGTPAEHLQAILSTTGFSADIIGGISQPNVAGAIQNLGKIAAGVQSRDQSGTVENPEKITGSINKKTIK